MINSIESLIKLLHPYEQKDIDLIIRAAHKSQQLHKGQFRDSGTSFFLHPLHVSEILVNMKMDTQSIVAGLLHDCIEDTPYNRTELSEEFGEDIALLVEGVTKISLVGSRNKESVQADTIQKMLIATVRDSRVIIIKLADKLHNMRTLEFKKPKRIREIAQECLDIYTHLADGFGITWLKDELEDLCFKHLYPEIYTQIKDYVHESQSEHQDYLAKIIDKTEDQAGKEGIQIKTTTRVKHCYSIYNKMKKREKKLEEIYDLFGIRIICNSTSNCYTVLGLIHQLWMPIHGRFKDYIAMPKSNHYQSLHTTVMGYNGRSVEIQIRTNEMEQTAQHGIAAHWQYKSNYQAHKPKYQDLAIMHQLRDLADIEGQELLEAIRVELLRDFIYVFTPKGQCISLPKGATPLDFAYHVHTEIGHHTSGAKADGKIIPLKQPLSNSQVIEIITHPKAHPRLDWLNYAKSRSARSKIHAWINKHDEGIIVNRNIIARQPSPAPAQPSKMKEKRTPQQNKGDIRLNQEGNFLVHFANCCKPKVGDDIVGYNSRGRGIIIHRKKCKNFLNIKDADVRTLHVEWEGMQAKILRKIIVSSHNSGDLFSEIGSVIRKNNVRITEGRIDNDEVSLQGELRGYFTLEFDSKESINRIMKNIRSIPSVHNLKQVPDSE